MRDKICYAIAGLSLLWMINKNHQEVQELREILNANNNNMAFIIVCKRIPPRGQADWVDWMRDNGNCELATGAKYAR